MMSWSSRGGFNPVGCFGVPMAIAACLWATVATAQDPGQGIASSEVHCILAPLLDTALSVSSREVVAERLVELGDFVDQGQVLLRFASGGLAARIERAKAELEYADRKSSRGARLSKVLTDVEKDELITDLAVKRAALRELELEALRFAIRAPHSGFIIETSVDVGEVVEDKPALRLVQIDQLRAEIDLPLAYLRDFEKGQTIQIASGEAEPRSAKVAFVDPVIDLASQSFRLHAEVDNSDLLWVAGSGCRVVAGQ